MGSISWRGLLANGLKNAQLKPMTLKNAKIVSVYTPRTSEAITSGRAYIYFFPLGQTEFGILRRISPTPQFYLAFAVSELLHVTEEARVYVALGRPERAIDVLNEHIRDVPRSMPAAWLMLLDLYHASGRQQDFRRLAEEFHLHCNVQAPPWEDFKPSESDEGGLETFPHILRQVAGLWRQPGCREYLEGLLYDNREGRRIGFPLAAYGEILLLLRSSTRRRQSTSIQISSTMASSSVRSLRPRRQACLRRAFRGRRHPRRPASTARYSVPRSRSTRTQCRRSRAVSVKA
jgi:hypothetical protein